MAVDSYDPTTGALIFADTGAPDIGVDPTLVSANANDVGNRIVRANLAALEAYAYKRAGLAGYALDTGKDYLHDGSGWQESHSPRTSVFASAYGIVTIGSTSGSTINFPTGRFTTIPAVFATPQNNGTVVVPHISSVTQTSFLLRMYTLAGVAVASGNCVWGAVQKLPASLGG